MYLSMAFHARESLHWSPDHTSTALPYLLLPFLLVYLCPDSLSLSAVSWYLQAASFKSSLPPEAEQADKALTR